MQFVARRIERQADSPFYLLTTSWLPLFTGATVGSLALLIITKLHDIQSFSWLRVFGPLLTTDLYTSHLSQNSYINGTLNFNFLATLVVLGFILWSWSRELVFEAYRKGLHTTQVQNGLMYGMALFLLSEAMLFFPFFWAFFHTSLSPSYAIGMVWPPVGIEILDPSMLPLVNTVVLLTSGVSLVSAHRAIVGGNYGVVVNGLYVTIMLGIFFSWLQFIEYGLTGYTISDSTFGSIFFMLTGLHGFHVLVGTMLLMITYLRACFNTFSTGHHVLFNAAAWYWHFVDVVWLGVYIAVYVNT